MALERQDIVDAAQAISDAEGIDRVTVRAIARRLGVQAPTLYWHVRNKAELIEAIADEIVSEALRAVEAVDAAAGWRNWITGAVLAWRGALLSHRDGARIVAGARDSLARADFTERAIAALVEDGIELQRARLVVIAVERFTLGFVLEEQSLSAAGETPDVEDLKRRLPLSTKAIIDYYAEGRTADDLFVDGIRLIID